MVKVGPGLEFIHGMLIDQHFAQRGRSGRLLSAVAQHPHQLGIGIDENTALVVQGEEFEVIGEGAVTVLDVGAATYDDVMEHRDHEHLAILGARLHVLPAGFRFNLQERAPVGQRPSPKRKGSERSTS